MFSENKKISGRQIFRLLTFDILGLSTLVLPQILAEFAAVDGIFCIGAGVLLAVLYLKVLGAVASDMQGSYLSYLEQKLGKFPGKAVILGYLIYFILLAAFTAHLFASVILKHLLREETFLLVLFLILLLSGYGLYSGMEGRARVYEILFWLVLIPFFLMLFSALWDVRTDYWTPVFTGSWQGTAEGSYAVFVSFSKIFLLLFAGKHVVSKRSLIRAGKYAIVLCGVIHAVLFLILVGIFGSQALAAMEFPAVTMMSTVQVTGGFLKRTDALMSGVWFFTLYALLSSAVYYGSVSLLHLFGRMEWTKKTGKIALPVLVLIFGLAYLFYRDASYQTACEKFLWYIGTPFIVLIPLILAAATLFSGKRSSGGRRKKVSALLCLCLLALPLSGCNTAELEDKNFPIEIAVTDTEHFGAAFLNEENGGNKLADYSHLKMIFLEQEFIEDEKAMKAFLELMESKLDVPRNTYVVVTEDANRIMELGDEMGEATGTYLEESFENVTEINKKSYPTLGMLYQEKENHMETLFIPYITELDHKPAVDHYFVWKRGKAAGELKNETALLSFFTENEMDSYVVALEKGEHVRLFGTHNEISFAQSEDGKRKIIVDVFCNGEVLYNEDVQKNTASELEAALAEYMNDTAAKALLEYRVDVTDSFKRLGGENRSWYFEYKKKADAFEKEMHTEYRMHVTWVNL